MANRSHIKPTTTYVMTNQEKKAFMHVKELRTPTNYVENLQKRVKKDGKLKLGLKSMTTKS